jgi:hypothetical protein
MRTPSMHAIFSRPQKCRAGTEDNTLNATR